MNSGAKHGRASLREGAFSTPPSVAARDEMARPATPGTQVYEHSSRNCNVRSEKSLPGWERKSARGCTWALAPLKGPIPLKRHRGDMAEKGSRRYTPVGVTAAGPSRICTVFRYRHPLHEWARPFINPPAPCQRSRLEKKPPPWIGGGFEPVARKSLQAASGLHFFLVQGDDLLRRRLNGFEGL